MALNSFQAFVGFLGFPGPTELMIIVVIILVLFGGAKLPEMARNIGRGMRVFKEEANTLRKEIELTDEPAKTAATSKESSDATAAKTKDVTAEVKVEASESKSK